MSTVPKPRARGERPDPPAFRLDDPNMVCAWLAGLRAHVLDAVAAGEDATRRVHARVLSRAEARRRLRAAERALLQMIEIAEQAVPHAPRGS
ncbi:MAG: hypothetical protein QM820_49100 [Minicystis sp.]